MHPEICSIGPFVVYSYGFMLVVAFLVAVTLASYEAKRQGINPDFIFNFNFIIFVFGIIGSRLFYVSYNLGYYFDNPKEIIMLSHGGMSWFGGFFLGLCAGLIYIRLKKERIYKVLDLVVPFLALAQSLGRIGCFLNGCCFGKESIYGVYFPVHGLVLIPTQLYSSFILLLIFIILRFIQLRPHRLGQVFYTYLFLYSIKRFFIEFLRGDNKLIIFDLTLFQLISIAIFIIATLKLINRDSAHFPKKQR
ncbi:MAG: prolipoprotein diacylglyceryl transferase [Candidatus Omnitrophica bacterium]|nr:prolipoprotein diacylglyceryl transferase [Candidatus Omnitrophota bacterium]